MFTLGAKKGMVKYLRKGHFYACAPIKKTSSCDVVKNLASRYLLHCQGGLPRNSVARLTDRARNDLKYAKGP